MIDEPPVNRFVNEGEWCLQSETTAWSAFRVAPGDIMEFSADLIEDFGGAEEFAGLLVTSTDTTDEGSLVVMGRAIGSTSEALNRKLGVLVNRGNRGVHLCWDDPCPKMETDELVHTNRVRWFSRGQFAAPYLKPWGRMVIKDYDDIEKEAAAGKAKGRAAADGKGAGTVPAASGKKPKAKAKEKEEKGRKDPKEEKSGKEGRGKRKAREEKGGDPGAGGAPRGTALDERLSKLRKALTGGEEPGEPEVIDLVGGSEEDEESNYESMEEEEEKSPKAPVSPLVLVPVKRETAEAPVKKRKRVKKKKIEKDPSSQLLAIAAQARQEREERERSRRRKKKRKGATGQRPW